MHMLYTCTPFTKKIVLPAAFNSLVVVANLEEVGECGANEHVGIIEGHQLQWLAMVVHRVGLGLQPA